MIAQVPRRGDQGERPARAPGRAPASSPHGHASRLPLPVGARRHQRRAARAGHVAGRPGDAPRHAGHLHGLHRLRRDRPPQRPGAAGVAGRARRRRPRAAGRCSRPPRTRRGRIAS